jgi:hypothetical protein
MTYLIAAAVGLVAALFLWDAGTSIVRQAKWARGVIVEGEVVELRVVPASVIGEQAGTIPVLTYKTPQGEVGRFESVVGFYPSRYALGDRLAVRYIGGAQPRAELESALSHTSFWGSLLMGALFSVIALAIGLSDQIWMLFQHR